MTAKRYTHSPLKYYKLDSSVKDPIFATEGSACFDIHAYIPNGTKVKIYDEFGNIDFITCTNGSFTLEHDWRAMIPTGLIFDISEGWVVKLYARSGLALKQGLVLANAVGIVDSDYVDPVFAIMQNTSNCAITFKDGTRICQGYMDMVPKYNLIEVSERPGQKTERDGGFGSTGIGE
jgi:dUTP pyrophosphatase